MRIEVSVGEIGELDNAVYSVFASLYIGKEPFIIELFTLDQSDDENLEIIEAFCTRWELKKEEDKINLTFTEELNELIEELQYRVDEANEQKEIENEKTLKRCS